MKSKIATVVAMVTLLSTSAFAEIRDCPEIDKTLADVKEYLENSWLSPKLIGQVPTYNDNQGLNREIQRVHGILMDQYRFMIYAAGKEDSRALAAVYGDMIPVANDLATRLLNASNRAGLSAEEARKIRADGYNLTNLALRVGVDRGCIENGK